MLISLHDNSVSVYHIVLKEHTSLFQASGLVRHTETAGFAACCRMMPYESLSGQFPGV
jgi:hypothetical protein